MYMERFPGYTVLPDTTNSLRSDIQEARRERRQDYADFREQLHELTERIAKCESDLAYIRASIGPVEKLVYGLVATILLSVLTAILSALIKGGPR